MKLILFIGQHKVGTTALQAFLAANRAALLQRGVLYPDIRANRLYNSLEKTAYRLAARLSRRALPAGLPINQREPHNALAFRMIAEHRGQKNGVPFHRGVPASGEIFDAIHKQMRRSEAHTVILCSEVFTNFAAISPDLIQRLRDALPAEQVTFICSLRRVDQYLVSWHGQRLKFGQKLPALRQDPVSEYGNTVHLDYRLMLEGWINALPGAELHVRNYSELLAAGGAVTDFLAICGLDAAALPVVAKRANPSFSPALYEIVRQVNWTATASAAAAFRRNVLSAGRWDSSSTLPAVELLGARSREALFDYFQPVHDYLAELTGRPRFFPDLEKILQLQPVPENGAATQALEELREHFSRQPDMVQALSRVSLDSLESTTSTIR